MSYGGSEHVTRINVLRSWENPSEWDFKVLVNFSLIHFLWLVSLHRRQAWIYEWQINQRLSCKSISQDTYQRSVLLPWKGRHVVTVPSRAEDHAPSQDMLTLNSTLNISNSNITCSMGTLKKSILLNSFLKIISLSTKQMTSQTTSVPIRSSGTRTLAVKSFKVFHPSLSMSTST